MKRLLALIGVMVASVAIAAVDVEGVWGFNTDHEEENVPMCLLNDGRGLMSGYICALPIQWSEISNGVIKVMCSDFGEMGMRSIFRYDSEKGTLTRLSQTIWIMCERRIEEKTKPRIYTRMQVPAEEMPKFKKQLQQEVDGMFKRMAEAGEKNKKERELAESNGIERREFVWTPEHKESELVALLEDGWSFFACTGKDGVNVRGNWNGGCALSVCDSVYIFGDESEKDTFPDCLDNCASPAKAIPPEAKFKERGCSEKFLQELAWELKIQKSELKTNCYCNAHMHYGVYSKELSYDGASRSANDIVAGTLAALKKVAKEDIKVWLCRSEMDKEFAKERREKKAEKGEAKESSASR